MPALLGSPPGEKGRSTSIQSGRPLVAPGQEGQDLADGALPPVRFWRREVRLDVVAVASAGLLLDHVAGLDQIRNDAEGAAFGDVQAGCDVAQAHAGVMGDEQENPGVISQEGPACHLDRLSDSGKNLLVSLCRYSVALGTGRQPSPAASIPGLPEEQMCTDSVITIVGAHDARSAASRLTRPVPVRHGVSAIAATLGRSRRQLTPGLLGVS